MGQLGRTPRLYPLVHREVRRAPHSALPLRVYFKNGRAKVEIALARGKEQRDKRRELAKREADRQIERALKSRR